VWAAIGFYYHTFTATQSRYPTNVLEYLAHALTMLRYSHFLRDCNVICWSDHYHLLYDDRSDNPKILRISLMLLWCRLQRPDRV